MLGLNTATSPGTSISILDPKLSRDQTAQTALKQKTKDSSETSEQEVCPGAWENDKTWGTNRTYFKAQTKENMVDVGIQHWTSFDIENRETFLETFN